MNKKLGCYISVPPGCHISVPTKDVFSHESDFTFWVVNHIQELAIVLNMPLFDAKSEQRVGRCRTDIMAITNESDKIIIENQIGRSDHNHYGQLTTKMRKGIDYGILIAEVISDDCINSMNEWNKVAENKKRLYAVEFQCYATKYDDGSISVPGVTFKSIVKPDEVEFIKREFAGKDEKEIKQRIFLQKLREEIRRKEPGLLNFNSGLTDRYTNFGLPEAHLSLIFRKEHGKRVLGIEFHLEKGRSMNSKRLKEIKRMRPTIEKSIGPIEFGNIAEKKTNFKMWLKKAINAEILNNEMIDDVAQIASQLYNILNPLLTQWKKESLV